MLYRTSETGYMVTLDVLGAGAGPVEVWDYAKNIRYLYCDPVCEAETRAGQFPRFYKEANDVNGGATTIGATAVTKWTKANAATSGTVAEVYVDAAGLTVRAVMSNGKTYDFTNYVAPAGSATGPAWIGTCPQQKCDVLMDICFVIDESGSVSDSEYNNQMKPFIIKVLDAYTWGVDATQFAAVYFNSGVHTVVTMTASRTAFNSKFTPYGSPSYGSSTTNTPAGIDAGVVVLHNKRGFNPAARYNAEKLMMVITDGETYPYVDITPNCQAAQNPPNNILMFGIGIDGAKQSELDIIGSNIPGVQTAFLVTNWNQLNSIVASLVKAVCVNLPQNPCGPQCGGYCSYGKTCICPNDCSDGNLCTTDLGCANQLPNKCAWSPKNIDDSNLCTTDSCNPATGAVTNVYDNRCSGFTLSCGVGVCNPLDGSCSTKTNATCDDKNYCTVDKCIDNGGGVSSCTNITIPGCNVCAQWQPSDQKCVKTSCDGSSGSAVTVQQSGASSCKDVEVISNNILYKWTPCTPGVCDPLQKDAQGNPCTSPETCCSFPPMDCDVDKDPCTIDVCNETDITTTNGLEYGTCYSTPNACDDNNDCTADTCTANVGCQHTLRTDVCPTGGVCIAAKCVNECLKNPNRPQDPCAWNIKCVNASVDCSAHPGLKDKINDCQFAFCQQGAGCGLGQVPGAEIDDCGQCNPPGKEAQVCIAGLEAEEAAGIAAGVLAAIIIGVIAFLLLAGVGGAGAYKVYSKYRGNMTGAQSNPLFEDKKMEGESPLYDE
jgi:von Willebrand factor type A domain/Dictyostelium (slime mold) repeat